MALNASGGIPVSPGTFAFLSFVTALLNSSQVMGSSSSHRVQRWGTWLRRVGLVAWWVLYTRLKWGEKTDMLSKLFEARDPSGKRISIVVFFSWWADLPFVRRRMCSHARQGSMRILWILEQISAYQVALACDTTCAMWQLRHLRSACMVAWASEERWWVRLIVWRTWLRSASRGASVARLIWNHPLHWRLW